MKARNKLKIIAALIFVIIVLNWSTITELLRDNNSTEQITENPSVKYEENTTDPDVYFCPEDDCLGEMLAWLDAAEEYIHCALFEVGLLELQEKLFQRSEEIEVKLITDNRYFDEVKHLDFARHDNRSGLMHDKFCVLDGKAVWTGSFNPTERGAFFNNNNAVFYQ